jgi:sensor histidine kinase YesM
MFFNRHFYLHHRHLHSNMQRRCVSVILITLVLSVVLWGFDVHNSFDVQLVYGMSTSLAIWFLTDPLRQKIFTQHREGALWQWDWRTRSYTFVCIVIGFFVGMFIGDWYAGRSSWDLIDLHPQKYTGIVVVAFAISAAFIAFFSQQNKLEVARAQATESKLQLLQSQLEPHMLFNTLANLRALIDIDAERAQAMLDRLIDYLRATLGASRVTSHALSLEFDRLDDYLALMQIRMGRRVTYRLDLPDALKATPCPALLLQPVVENAVLHGLEPSASGGEITVAARIEGKQLMLIVTDTGTGFENTQDHTSSESNSGFGLTQLRERLETLYGLRASVDIASQLPSGTQVTISIPHSTSSHETNFCSYC